MERRQLPQERGRLRRGHGPAARQRQRLAQPHPRLGLRHLEDLQEQGRGAQGARFPAEQGLAGLHRVLRAQLPGPRREPAAVLPVHRREVPCAGRGGLQGRVLERAGSVRDRQLVQGRQLHPAAAGERLQRPDPHVRGAQERPGPVRQVIDSRLGGSVRRAGTPSRKKEER
ncbi:hypothetical protein MICRO8M_100049 [Microbacterium sp. 8M]|nr:hypothetical protein MICRO8M_100049 [Microbacterium sp. 8M]